MIEERHIEGRWWPHTQPNLPQYGILHFSPQDGVVLETKVPQTSSFWEIITEEQDVESALIHGRDAHDRSISLFSCFPYQQNRTTGLKTTRYSVGCALIGREFNSWQDVVFDGFEIELTHLNAWLNLPAFEERKYEDGILFYGYKSPTPLEWQLPNGTTLKVVTTFGAHEPDFDSTTLTLYQKPHLVVRFASRGKIKEVNQWALLLKRFLTLAVGVPIYVRQLKGISIPEDPSIGEEHPDAKIEILRSNPGASAKIPTIIPQRMLFAFEPIKDRFGEVLTRWIDYTERLEPVVNLYFAVIFNRNLYENHKFLFLAQALERYHAIQIGGTREPVDKFDARLSAAKALLGDDFSFFYDKLKWSNEKVLFDRLRELIELRRTLLQDVVQSFPNFPKLVKDTRNYYTHFDSALLQNAKIADGAQLTRLIECMRITLEILILDDLQLGSQPIARAKKRRIAQIVEYDG